MRSQPRLRWICAIPLCIAVLAFLAFRFSREEKSKNENAAPLHVSKSSEFLDERDSPGREGVISHDSASTSLVVFQVGAEVKLGGDKNEDELSKISPEEKELAESLPVQEVYRRFHLEAPDWEVLRGLRVGQTVTFPIPGVGKVAGDVQLVDLRPGQPFGIAGKLKEGFSGTFSLVQDPLVGMRGFLLPDDDYRKAYRFTEESGECFLDEVDKGAIVCHGMPRGIATDSSLRGPGARNPAVPLLQSRPGAPGVLYIDLDGEQVTDPFWNGGQAINATAPVFSDPATIQKLWQEVAEAFASFNINVTTDVSVYNGATPGRRMRIIVTSNNWYGSGGVAQLSSFQWAGTTPCWAFNGADNLDQNIHFCAMTISHEFGHTFGLWHDGVLPANPFSNDLGAYYQGHMTPVGGWGPIMGAPFAFGGGANIPIRPIVQWSMGDYAGTNVLSGNIFTKGNNNQNDVGIIAGPLNQVGYVSDDYPNTPETAVNIPQTSPDSGIISLTNGLIHADSDVDVFRIYLYEGNLSVSATNAPVSPTLKLSLTLLNPDGLTTNTVSDPANRMTASLSTNLASGAYYLRVEGVGTTTDTNTTNGFIGYGSIGQYQLSGSFQSLPRPPGDNFSDECIPLGSGNPFSSNNTALGATAQAGERGYVSGKARTTIWYSWVAPGSGFFNLNTHGSGFDTTLAVCRPQSGRTNSLSNLVLVAANDNSQSGTNLTNTSAVRFQAIAGMPYYFVVDSAKGIISNGLVRLNGSGSLSSGKPVNDDFSNPITLAGASFSHSGSLLAAGAQTNEPSMAGLAATRSVWFSWTCPANGRLSLSTSNSDCDTVLGIYSGTVAGTNWSALRLLAANDNVTIGNNSSLVSLAVSNGANYRFKIDSRRSASGGYVLNGNLQATPNLAVPSSITFALPRVSGQRYRPEVFWQSVSGALNYQVDLFRGTNRISGVTTARLNWTNGPLLVVSNGMVGSYGVRIRAVSNSIGSPWSALVPAQ